MQSTLFMLRCIIRADYIGGEMGRRRQIDREYFDRRPKPKPWGMLIAACCALVMAGWAFDLLTH